MQRHRDNNIEGNTIFLLNSRPLIALTPGNSPQVPVFEFMDGFSDCAFKPEWRTDAVDT